MKAVDDLPQSGSVYLHLPGVDSSYNKGQGLQIKTPSAFAIDDLPAKEFITN